ncbi:MAG: hypothetical protein RI922_2064 [Bacteroidota bacterium]|jgi:hypothetical protein
MKKNIFKSAAILLLSVFVLSACSKYEEGPKFTLLTKKARLSGEWVIESVTYNTTDITSSYEALLGANFVLEIEKDGGYRTEGSNPDTGTWELGEDKDDIRFLSSASGATEETFRILKLKNKELWWKQTQTNGDIIEFHYIAK